MVVDYRIGGYTIIEVLVAMTILALALTVLMRIFGGGLRNISVAADYTHAVLLAESQLAVAGTAEPLLPGQADGSKNGKFVWTRTVEEFLTDEQSGIDDLPVVAYRVSVDVEWPNHGRTRTVHLSTIKLGSQP